MKHSDFCTLSIDAGGTSLKAALLHQGSIIQDTFFSVPVRSDGTKEEIRLAYELLGQTARRLETLHQKTIDACAVCIPGPFDYAGGRFLMHHKYQAVYGRPLRPWIQEGLGRELPIRFLHDSTAFLLGACLAFPGLAQKRICGVIIGTGLGFASMIDGRILEREDKGPGISIFSRPYLDKTAEDHVSKRGILSRYHQLVPDFSPDTDVKALAALACGGNPQALSIFRETGTHLAAILHPVITKYRFEYLLLGGAISKSADLFLPSLTEGLSGAPVSILPAQDPDMAPILGAAQYLFY